MNLLGLLGSKKQEKSIEENELKRDFNIFNNKEINEECIKSADFKAKFAVERQKLIESGFTNMEEKIDKLKNEILKEEKDFNNSMRIENDVYSIDEIGDDEKYFYLTRKSDGKQFQEFEISDDLYEKALNDFSIIDLKYENGEYKIKN